MKFKKILKWVLLAIPVLLILGVAFIIGASYLEHRELVEQEKERHPAPGNMVDLYSDGDKLHVYTEGEGEITLVFMSGLGTSSPKYDFKVLYEKLSDHYRIAVVERAGYGWSDITSNPRDLDTVLEETRTALKLSGESPPYVLFPHSLAGLEALYWANLYPDEIETIIGLDPLVPSYYEQAEEEPSFSGLISFLANTGLMRNQPDVFQNNFPAMQKGLLSDSDAEIARTIFFRRVQTENMWEEIDMLDLNAQKVSEQGTPDLPFHVFISNENDDKSWSENLTALAAETSGEHFLMDAGHYIHLDKPGVIAEKSKELIESTAGN